MRRSISFINTTADGTGTRGVPGIDIENGDTRQFSFVLDKTTELEEGPRMQSCPLTAPNPYPLADPLEVFKSDSPVGALSSGNYALGDAVVYVTGETLLFATTKLQEALGRLSALPLEFLVKSAVATPKAVDLGAAVENTVRVSGDILDSEVDAKHAFNIFGRRLLNLAIRHEVKSPLNIGKVGFTLPGLEQASLVVPTDKRNRLTPCKGPDGHGFLVETPAKNPVVVGDGAGWLEGALVLLVELVGVGNFGDTTNNHLCRKTRGSPHFVIAGTVERPLPERLMLPSPCTNLVADSISFGKCIAQCLSLLRRRSQFNFGRQFHSYIIPQIQVWNKYKERGLASSPA